MITLTNRQVEEIRWLVLRDEATPLNALAFHFRISTRTARDDLALVESYVQEYDIDLRRIRGRGISLYGSFSNKQAMIKALSRASMRSLLPKERQMCMALILLICDIATVQQLADICIVSRQTAVRDMQKVISILQTEGVEVAQLRGRGTKVCGSELRIRHAFIQLLANNTCSDEVTSYLIIHSQLQGHLCDANTLLDACEQAIGTSFQDREYLRTIICFVLSRISRGCILHDSELVNNIQVDTKIQSKLDQAISFLITPDEEKRYLAAIILSQRVGPHLSDAECSVLDSMNAEAEHISQYLIYALSKNQKIGDEVSEVLPMLTAHIRAALYRQKNQICIHDESLESYIRMTSPLIYEFTRDTLESYGSNFVTSEVAYIAMYLASIFETSKGKELVPTVLFVCAYGLATSILLKSRLEQLLFGCRLVGPISKADAPHYLETSQVDLIISACDFTTDVSPVLTVSPMLTQRDIDRVKSCVNQLPFTKISASFVEQYSAQKQKSFSHKVSDFVDEECVQVIDSCMEWDKAIQLAAHPLVERKAIGQRYVETMIHAVLELGPYMVLTPEVAYVHAGTDDGIAEDCTAVLVSKHPIQFGFDQVKSVRAIVIVGIMDKEKSNLLSLASIFGASTNINTMRNSHLSVGSILAMHD